jgi:hypothetical protein
VPKLKLQGFEMGKSEFKPTHEEPSIFRKKAKIKLEIFFLKKELHITSKSQSFKFRFLWLGLELTPFC